MYMYTQFDLNYRVDLDLHVCTKFSASYCSLVKNNELTDLCHKAINPSDKATDYFVDFAVHSIILRLSGSRTHDYMQRSWCSNPAIGGEML